MKDLAPQPHETLATASAKTMKFLARHFGETIKYEVLTSEFSRCGVMFFEEINLQSMVRINTLLESKSEFLNYLAIIGNENETIRIL